MQWIGVHAFVAGCLCVLLLLVAVAIGVHRKEADRRPSDPHRITRVVLITVGVAVYYWPLVPLAYGVGSIAGAGVGVVRNGVDRRRALMSHRWTVDDD